MSIYTVGLCGEKVADSVEDFGKGDFKSSKIHVYVQAVKNCENGAPNSIP